MSGRHICNPWDGCYRPSHLRWWSETIPDFGGPGTLYSHVTVLNDLLFGKSADDMEALSDCFQRVVHEGERTASGRWCVCLQGEAPSAGEARGSLGSDGFSGLDDLLSDLKSAADRLPIGWKSTERVFIAQGRSAVWGARFTYYNRNLRVREIDRWLEPRDPETGRPRSTSLTYWLMARSLGGVSDVCAWPRDGSIVQREVFTAALARAKAAAALEEAA